MKTYVEYLAKAKDVAFDAKALAESIAAEDRALTDDERAKIMAMVEESTVLYEKGTQMKQDYDAIAALDEIANGDFTIPGEEPLGTKSYASLGERFVKSDAYADFKRRFPSGAGGTSAVVDIQPSRIGTLEDWYTNRKSSGSWPTPGILSTPDAFIPDVRMPTIDQIVRPRLSLLDLVSRGSADGDFEYLQIVNVVRNAAIVPEATGITDDNALKPLSDLGTELAYARAFTYADGFPVTNQMLSDAPALASFMSNELRYNLDNIIEAKLLGGTGNPGDPLGLEYATGTQSQTYTVGASDDPAMEFVKGIRKAITKVTYTGGGNVTGILISPEDEEAIDLMQDGEKRFFGQGPFGSGFGTLWGRPRVVSERLSQGEAWVGEWNQMALLDREGLSVLAFNQHDDWARRNLTYVRAELRAMQVIWRPIRFCKVTLAGSGS